MMMCNQNRGRKIHRCPQPLGLPKAIAVSILPIDGLSKSLPHLTAVHHIVDNASMDHEILWQWIPGTEI